MSHTEAADRILCNAPRGGPPERPRTRAEFTRRAAWHTIELAAAEAIGDLEGRARSLAAAMLYAHHASLLGGVSATLLLKQLPRR